MIFDFSGTLARWDLFAYGAIMTLSLSLGAMLLGMVVGMLGAIARLSRQRALRAMVGGYVEIVRNTPFLVQLYIVYFGLPALGLRFGPVTASLLSLTVYVGAYLTELLRAGLQNVPRAQLEAAQALGLSWFRRLRHVVVPQALASLYPALVSQFVLLMLASSIVSSVSTRELTGTTNDIQGETFRSFEAFVVVAAIYLVLTAALRTALMALDRRVFAFRYAAR
jgi:polar amino acid transport system permease protein